MKYFALISIVFFAFALNAQNLDPALLEKLKVLSCDSTTQGIPSGLITLNQGKHMTEFTVDGQVVWKVNLDTEDSTVDVIKLKDMNVDQFPVIKHMVKLANPKNSPKVQAIKLSMVATKNGQQETLPERIDRISDDAAGYIYLETLNSKNKVLGNSVMAAWAGFFKSCK